MHFNYNIFSKKQSCFCILMFWNWRNIKINLCLVKCPCLVSFVSALRPLIWLLKFSWFNVSLLWFNFYNTKICENNAYTICCLYIDVSNKMLYQKKSCDMKKDITILFIWNNLISTNITLHNTHKNVLYAIILQKNYVFAIQQLKTYTNEFEIDMTQPSNGILYL